MRFFVLLLSLGLFCQNLSAAEIPIGNPVSDRLFLLARELYGRGALDRFEYGAIGDLRAGNLDPFEQRLRAEYLIQSEDFTPSFSQPTITADLTVLERNRQTSINRNFIKLFPRVRADFNPNLSAALLYRIDGELDDDPRYDGKSWKGVAGFVETATIDYNRPHFGLRFGIERLSWGYGRTGNLMFSDQAMPLTMLALSYRRSIFDFEVLAGFLNPLKDQLDRMVDDTSFFTSQQRYIASHAITIRPIRNLSLSLRETVLYGGPGRRFEPAYAIPFVWYHGYQLDSRMDDNILSSIAADWRLAGRLWLYGEFLVDDFQIEKKSRGDYEPNQLAGLLGAEIYDIALRGSTLALEYVRINNWTYNQGRAHNRYLNQNFPLGYPTGPDGDIFDWELSWWARDYIRVALSGHRYRQGQGRIDSPWTRPWLDSDRYREPFPSGTVMTETTTGLSILAYNKNRFWGNLRLNFTDINNVANTAGTGSGDWELSLDLGIKLPSIRWGL